jgi:hypothetical protein
MDHPVTVGTTPTVLESLTVTSDGYYVVNADVPAHVYSSSGDGNISCWARIPSSGWTTFPAGDTLKGQRVDLATTGIIEVRSAADSPIQLVCDTSEGNGQVYAPWMTLVRASKATVSFGPRNTFVRPGPPR